MAGRSGQPPAHLIDDLLESPEAFDFFQAVRLIEQAVSECHHLKHVTPVGSVTGPQSEAVRFRAVASRSFAAGDICDVQTPAADSSAQDTGSQAGFTLPIEIIVPFMGLTGPNGALPDHYTTLLIERAHQRTKDYSLREFFDLFNHRAISLFYLAWQKYRFSTGYEQQVRNQTEQPDVFTDCLYSLTGLGLPQLRNRFDFDDQAILYFGGLFAQSTRTATGLQQLLSEFSGLPVIVQQFVGQWLYLTPDVQSSLPTAALPGGMNMSLGENIVIGSRVWDVQGRFRIRVGPLSWPEFSSLLPGSPALKALDELVRFYAGPRFDYDCQLILRAEDVPSCQLGGTGSNSPFLGTTTWMGRQTDPRNAEDAVFQLG